MANIFAKSFNSANDVPQVTELTPPKSQGLHAFVSTLAVVWADEFQD